MANLQLLLEDSEGALVVKGSREMKSRTGKRYLRTYFEDGENG